jgi:hypothetical protein
MDIEVWLQGLGLERYVPAFRDNEIDWDLVVDSARERGAVLTALKPEQSSRNSD